MLRISCKRAYATINHRNRKETANYVAVRDTTEKNRQIRKTREAIGKEQANAENRGSKREKAGEITGENTT